jgi:hypothetical protein
MSTIARAQWLQPARFVFPYGLTHGLFQANQQ